MSGTYRLEMPCRGCIHSLNWNTFICEVAQKKILLRIIYIFSHENDKLHMCSIQFPFGITAVQPTSLYDCWSVRKPTMDLSQKRFQQYCVYHKLGCIKTNAWFPEWQEYYKLVWLHCTTASTKWKDVSKRKRKRKIHLFQVFR